MRIGGKQGTRGSWSIRVALATVALLVPLASGSSAPAATATSFQHPLRTWRQSGYGFGSTWLRSCGSSPKRHVGIDLAARAGETIRAIANGKVIGVLLDRTGPWGYSMLVQHSVPGEGTVISRYGHVRPRSGYRAGRTVTKGEAIATVYNLGSNTHFALGIHVGAYDRWAWRGALPNRSCGGDPAFPHRFVDPTRYLKAHMDRVAPRTSVRAVASTSSASGSWTQGSWRLTFSCRDDASGCRRTTTSTNGTLATGRSLSLDTEGLHAVRYRSVDARGNVESWRSIVRGIDRTAPDASLEPSSFTFFRSSSEVHLEVDALDTVAGSPGAASGIRRVRFFVCPQRRSSDAECWIVPGRGGPGRWTADPSPPPDAYVAWAAVEDTAGNVGRSNEARFVVLGG